MSTEITMPCIRILSYCLFPLIFPRADLVAINLSLVIFSKIKSQGNFYYSQSYLSSFLKWKLCPVEWRNEMIKGFASHQVGWTETNCVLLSFICLFFVVFFISLTWAIVIWEEEILSQNMSPLDCLLGKSVCNYLGIWSSSWFVKDQAGKPWIKLAIGILIRSWLQYLAPDSYLNLCMIFPNHGLF